MPDSFNTNNMPFALLNEQEQKTLSSSLDIAYYQKDEVIIEAGSKPEGVYIIFKGRVSERDGQSDGDAEHVFVHYGEEDYFGAWSAIRGRAIHNFNAEEETICHVLPVKILKDLMAGNALFNDYFQQNIATKTRVLEQHSRSQDMTEFMLARVSEGLVHKAVIVQEGTGIREATRRMREQKQDCLLVQRGNRYGMVTGTDLLNAAIIDGCDLDEDVAGIASYRLVTVTPDDYLFNALIIMTQQQIERVVVMQRQELVGKDPEKQNLEEQAPPGLVNLTDLLSYFSSHSHVIGLRIERAVNIDELREAAFGLDDLIKALVFQGVKARFVMDLIAAMNERIISRLFDFIIPANMQPHVCLLVMGSEGRGEQIIKTDQDNALVFRDGLDWPDMHSTLNRFSEALVSFGFPPCPGNIMVSNPLWVKSLGDWTQMLSDWTRDSSGTALMNLAIAVDAKPIAGNPAIYKAAKNWYLRFLRDDRVFIAHFARAALKFDTPLGLFGRLKHQGELDIKKGGIFPIVHGVRAMALEQRLRVTNTFARIETLVDNGQLKPHHGQSLADALALFIRLRLKQQVQALEQGNNQAGHTNANTNTLDPKDSNPNLIHVGGLNKMERDLLRDALYIVKKFKTFLELRYQLGGY